MFRKMLLSSAALVLAGSSAFASPKVTTVDINGAKLSMITELGHSTQQPRLHVPGATFNNLDLKYPNGTFIPWQAYLFCGSTDADCTGPVNFAYPFTTSGAPGQKVKGFDLALEVASGTGGVTICLETDSGGVPSGTCVAGTSTYVPNQSLLGWGTFGPTVDVTFKSKSLTSATQYWAVAVADA
ncbi:MAG TPA: hypothetical protein VGK90_13900, partial [Rhizomicrobium sp.]